MVNRLQTLNWFDVTGGLNTRSSAFQLAPNEVPEILNMEIDARGGVTTRKGWGTFGTGDVVTVGISPFITLSNGKHVTVPDEAGFDLTGDMQIVVGLNLADWTPTAQGCILTKRETTDIDGYTLLLQADGKIRFLNYDVSGLLRQYTSSSAFSAVITPNTNWWVGISYDVNNGSGSSSCRFWQSNTGSNGPWTEVGVAQTVANVANIQTNGRPLRVGAHNAAGAQPINGKLLHAELRSAIGASNTMSDVSVVFELNAATDLAASEVDDLTFTTTSADTATLTGTGMLKATNWDPRNAILHETSDGVQHVYVANFGDLLHSTGGSWTAVTNMVVGCVPHRAGFAPWGDTLYLANGGSSGTGVSPRKVVGTTGTILTTSGAGQWQNDYTSSAGAHGPLAEHVAAHNGYLFKAGIRRDSVNYPNELRWSHPGQPERWHEFDFITFNEGGSKITALVPFGDRLLIFKTDSVWALFGSDADTWNPVKLTDAIGCPHEQGVAVGTESVYFFTGKDIRRYTNRGFDEVSYPLKNVFPDVPAAAYDNVWLGWVDDRLWASLPYDPESGVAPTEPVAIFVYDPVVGGAGAWTRFEGALQEPIGPYVGHASSADAPPLGFCRHSPHGVEFNVSEDAEDDMHGSGPVGFRSHIRTGWFDAGMPTLRKSWRRSDYVLRNLAGVFDLAVEVFYNYDASNVKRSHIVSIDALGDVLLWNGGVWGGGIWSGAEAGLAAQTKRGSTLGLTGAIALRFVPPDGARWGINAIVAKFVPRRLR